jgi:hypothetical protein
MWVSLEYVRCISWIGLDWLGSSDGWLLCVCVYVFYESAMGIGDKFVRVIHTSFHSLHRKAGRQAGKGGMS